MRQAAAIEQLGSDGKLDRLPPALREMARWRSKHPELNLGEIAGHMKLSKSAVKHRLRRQQQLAEPSSPKQERSSAENRKTGNSEDSFSSALPCSTCSPALR